jgi:thiamine pyrophosphokinase
LANLLILGQRDWPVPVRLAEGNEVAEILHGGEALQILSPPGSIVSAIPLSATVTGITYTGLQYPLENATLALGSTRGISNAVATSPATIAIDGGILLVISATAPES